MNRWLMQSVVPVVSIVCTALFASVQPSWAGDAPAIAATGVPEPPPRAAVFEMKYRELNAPDDP